MRPCSYRFPEITVHICDFPFFSFPLFSELRLKILFQCNQLECGLVQSLARSRFVVVMRFVSYHYSHYCIFLVDSAYEYMYYVHLLYDMGGERSDKTAC